MSIVSTLEEKSTFKESSRCEIQQDREDEKASHDELHVGRQEVHKWTIKKKQSLTRTILRGDKRSMSGQRDETTSYKQPWVKIENRDL